VIVVKKEEVAMTESQKKELKKNYLRSSIRQHAWRSCPEDCDHVKEKGFNWTSRREIEEKDRRRTQCCLPHPHWDWTANHMCKDHRTKEVEEKRLQWIQVFVENESGEEEKPFTFTEEEEKEIKEAYEKDKAEEQKRVRQVKKEEEEKSPPKKKTKDSLKDKKPSIKMVKFKPDEVAEEYRFPEEGGGEEEYFEDFDGDLFDDEDVKEFLKSDDDDEEKK
jgi:hypothetical protein